MEEMRVAIAPELELIESRIAAPTKELQSIMKLIRKSITKRDHKVCIQFIYMHTDSLRCTIRSLRAAYRLRSLQQLFDQIARQEGEITQ